MKISIENINGDAEYFSIANAEYLKDFAIRIYFTDGITRDVDFRMFLESSRHSGIRKYLNISNFKSFKLVNGNLNWNNFDMIFPLDDLHKGKIN